MLKNCSVVLCNITILLGEKNKKRSNRMTKSVECVVDLLRDTSFEAANFMNQVEEDSEDTACKEYDDCKEHIDID